MIPAFSGRAGLAPMAGVTDAAMRLLCHEQGAAWSVSEMLSAKGWVYSGARNPQVKALLARMPGEGPVGLQLFGREPDFMAAAAGQLQDAGFDFIDINFGCPAPKIVRSGEGSALMREPETVGRIVRAVAEATRLSVTVKIRSGWDEHSVNAPLIAAICQDSGAAAVTVHARTRSQFYAGKADWDVIRMVKRAVRIPVIGNGDIFSGRDAVRMMELTGCDGVAVGRGAQGDPWLFREIDMALRGEIAPRPSAEEIIETAKRHFALEIQIHGERQGLLEMRKHIAWYVRGLRGAAAFRNRINTLDSREEVLAALEEFAGEQAGETYFAPEERKETEK